MYVATRNGIFANKGYGGGVFNGNVAFGAVGDDQVRAFQTQHGLKVDGIVGPQTCGKLTALYGDNPDGMANVPAGDPAWKVAELCMGWAYKESEKIAGTRTGTRAVQEMLNDSGYPVTVDGILGPETCGALSQLVAAVGISEVEVMDPSVKSALEWCGLYEAGQEPPQPPPEVQPAPAPVPDEDLEPLPSAPARGISALWYVAGAAVLVGGATAFHRHQTGKWFWE